MGVLAASMVRDALLSPILYQDQSKQIYHHTMYGLGFMVSKELIEDDLYGSHLNAFRIRTTDTAK